MPPQEKEDGAAGLREDVETEMVPVWELAMNLAMDPEMDLATVTDRVMVTGREMLMDLEMVTDRVTGPALMKTSLPVFN